MLLIVFLMLSSTVSSHNHDEVVCPKDCSCNGTIVECDIPALRSLSAMMFPVGTTVLDLQGNNLLNIPKSSIESLSELKELSLSGNKVYFIENGAFQGGSSIQKLCLEDNNIHFVESEVFHSLPNLEELNLKSNSLTKIPDLHKNTNIKKLYLSYNEIENIEDGSLANLTQLEELCLKKNKLTELNREIFATNAESLNTLNLNSNRLRDVPSVVKEMVNLVSLSLCYNPIKILEPEYFYPLTSLESLYLTGIGLTDFTTYQNWIPKLKTLGVSKNKLKGEILQKIRFPGLKTLLANNNPLGAVMSDSFRGILNVEKLELKSCDISVIDIRAFNQLVMLRELYLQDNQLTQVPSLRSNLMLETLDLSNNKISNIIKNYLRTLVALKTLNLSNNSLTTFPSDVFGDPSSLTLIDLSFNKLESTPLGISSEMTSLKYLNLSDNDIASISSDDFKDLTSLEILNLKGNRIMQLEDSMFASLVNLKELYLCRNQISLHSNTFKGLENLSKLTMDKNGVDAIDPEVFKNLQSLEVLSLNNNTITSISNNTFYNTPKLKEIWLLFNQLKVVPDMSKNSNLEVVGLCGNPIKVIPHGKFCPKAKLKKVLIRNCDLTELTAGVFPSAKWITYLHLASNHFQHVPRIVRAMSSLEVLKLSDNPIRYVLPREFEGLNRLREIRLDNLKVVSCDITEFFPVLPALRTLYLSGNPWDCNCDLQWYTLGIDGARARISTADWSNLTCQSPARLKGKSFDYLRLGDYRHCVPMEVRYVFETSAIISLPIIGKLALDHAGVYNKVSYQPLHGGKETVLRADKHKREFRLQKLLPGTDYLVCVTTVTPRNRMRRRHATDEDHQHMLTLDGATYTPPPHLLTETCVRFRTRSRNSNQTGSSLAAAGNSILRPHHMSIVYAVIGGAGGFALLLTAILTTVWCRRSHQRLSESMSPFGNISEDSIGGKQSDLNSESQSQASTRVVEEKGVTNGKAVEMKDNGQDNIACDVTLETKNNIRTKL